MLESDFGLHLQPVDTKGFLSPSIDIDKKYTFAGSRQNVGSRLKHYCICHVATMFIQSLLQCLAEVLHNQNILLFSEHRFYHNDIVDKYYHYAIVYCKC